MRRKTKKSPFPTSLLIRNNWKRKPSKRVWMVCECLALTKRQNRPNSNRRNGPLWIVRLIWLRCDGSEGWLFGVGIKEVIIIISIDFWIFMRRRQNRLWNTVSLSRGRTVRLLLIVISLMSRNRCLFEQRWPLKVMLIRCTVGLILIWWQTDCRLIFVPMRFGRVDHSSHIIHVGRLNIVRTQAGRIECIRLIDQKRRRPIGGRGCGHIVTTQITFRLWNGQRTLMAEWSDVGPLLIGRRDADRSKWPRRIDCVRRSKMIQWADQMLRSGWSSQRKKRQFKANTCGRFQLLNSSKWLRRRE